MNVFLFFVRLGRFFKVGSLLRVVDDLLAGAALSLFQGPRAHNLVPGCFVINRPAGHLFGSRNKMKGRRVTAID